MKVEVRWVAGAGAVMAWAIAACGGVEISPSGSGATTGSSGAGGARSASTGTTTPGSSGVGGSGGAVGVATSVGSGAACPAPTLGCIPGNTRYLGPCGEYCQCFSQTPGTLAQVCDPKGQWGATTCVPPTDCGSSAATTSTSAGGGCPSTCSGVCVDEESDPQNCGACGVVCAAQELCVMGGCRCASPCGATCPDLQNDAQNCGACGVACGTGQSCQAGVCVVASTNGLVIGSLAIEGSTLFWSSYSPGPAGSFNDNFGRVYAGPLGASAPTLLYEDPDMDVRAVIADTTSVYALDVAKSRLLSIPYTGKGHAVVLASGFTGASYSLALGAGYVFFPAGDGIQAVPIACGPSFQAGAGYAPSVTTAPSAFLWAPFTTANLLSAPLTGGPSQTLATATPCDGALAADGTNVYCLSESQVLKTRLTGGPLTSIATGSPQSRSFLAADGTNVYWVDSNNVYETPVGGGTTKTLVTNGSPGGPLVVDATNVYWALYQGVVQTPK